MLTHDYLPRIVGQDLMDQLLGERPGRPPRIKLDHYRPGNPTRPFMPVELSAAAFRFGHSQVRSGYRMNDTGGGAIFSDPPSVGDLHGGRPIPPSLAIDFKHFFDIPGIAGPPSNLTRRIDANPDLGLGDPGWSGQAPLWFCVLKEAELQHNRTRLGAVGGRIVGEVLLGLIDADVNSYASPRARGFWPGPPVAPALGQFAIGDLLRFANAA